MIIEFSKKLRANIQDTQQRCTQRHLELVNQFAAGNPRLTQECGFYTKVNDIIIYAIFHCGSYMFVAEAAEQIVGDFTFEQLMETTRQNPVYVEWELIEKWTKTLSC